MSNCLLNCKCHIMFWLLLERNQNLSVSQAHMQTLVFNRKKKLCIASLAGRTGPCFNDPPLKEAQTTQLEPKSRKSDEHSLVLYYLPNNKHGWSLEHQVTTATVQCARWHHIVTHKREVKCNHDIPHLLFIQKYNKPLVPHAIPPTLKSNNRV